MPGSDSARAAVEEFAGEFDDDVLELRRRIHTFPERSWMEQETADLVMKRLRAAGLSPQRCAGTGVICDIGADPRTLGRRRIALRADLDALPVPETTGLPYASQRAGLSHACGHDLHTAAVLGAGLVLARLAEAGQLPVGVRLVFQPSEEGQPSGARALVDEGVLEPVEQIFTLHTAPKLDVGVIGSRIGPITAASDALTVTLRGAGGHTSRPHLTGDVVFALGTLITQLPAVLGRRLDPRAGGNLTWGAVHAGSAANSIPATGSVTGTLRSLEVATWRRAGEVVDEAVHHILAPFDVEVNLDRQLGVPPVDNNEQCVAAIEAAARHVVGDAGVVLTEQSLGGEDFAWYLTQVPGAMIRLGTRTPGGTSYDLHQGDLHIDERAVGIAMRVMAHTALEAGLRPRPSPVALRHGPTPPRTTSHTG